MPALLNVAEPGRATDAVVTAGVLTVVATTGPLSVDSVLDVVTIQASVTIAIGAGATGVDIAILRGESASSPIVQEAGPVAGAPGAVGNYSIMAVDSPGPSPGEVYSLAVNAQDSSANSVAYLAVITAVAQSA